MAQGVTTPSFLEHFIKQNLRDDMSFWLIIRPRNLVTLLTAFNC